jgi:tetrahydromethanopterin:alpha-L-glutamate ligase
LAEAASRAVDIHYCGVDIIQDAQGKLYVLEVNSIPAWRGLQAVTELDIAQALVDDCLEQSSA